MPYTALILILFALLVVTGNPWFLLAQVIVFLLQIADQVLGD